MRIYNKIESSKLIKELNLNHFPEKVFKKGQTEEVLKFLNEFPVEFYAIRDKSKFGGEFKLAIVRDKVLETVKDYSLFSINVSSYNYVKNQKLVGEILVSKEDVSILASTDSNYSLRDVYKNPEFNFKTDIFNDKLLNNVPYFDEIFKYIFDNNLSNIIVEFAYFDKPVGVNKQNIIIYELRTDY